MDDLYKLFNDFMTTYDFYPRPIPGYQNRYINRLGMVYDNQGNQIIPYHYDNQYDTIYVRDLNGNPHIIGVHQAVSMTFDPNYYPGCIVHHKDENKYHNWDSNLEVISRPDHARLHNPQKYQPMIQTCQVCGRQFIWTSIEQQRYYIDLNRGKSRIISCSRGCSSKYGRLRQLGQV